MTALQLRLGPADHGRMVTADELAQAEYEGGFEYEVIAGMLYVSPLPNPAESFLNVWLGNALERYRASGMGPLNFVTGKSRVFVPGRPELTVPEPDIAAYTDWPLDTPLQQLRWEDTSPLVVAEVLVEGDPRKDLVRNVGLYQLVPSIAEYWVLDGRQDPNEPILTARRRHRNRWAMTQVVYGETYTTKLLPGFVLLIDPRQ